MANCTFFGHRDCPESIRAVLRDAIVDLIDSRNVDMFYVGNQGTFDAMARSVLRELQVIYPYVGYAVVLAYMPGKKASESVNEIDDTMLPEGIENVPKRFAISWRNKWMLDRSDFVIAYVAHSWGGAAKYVEKAKKQSKILVNLANG